MSRDVSTFLALSRIGEINSLLNRALALHFPSIVSRIMTVRAKCHDKYERKADECDEA